MVHVRDAAAQAWPPFVLVVGLLLLGFVAARDGLFAAAGRRLERLPGPPALLLVASLALVAVTTAILNLDTAVVFLTPVLVLAARHRGTDEAPFLLGAVFMANASSLFLPGSNLTNLLVLGDDPAGGAKFAEQMLPAALAACLVTGALLVLLHRRTLTAPAQAAPAGPPPPAAQRPGWVGPAGALAAGVLMVVLHRPALPVLGVALVCVAARLVQGRLPPGEVARSLNPTVLIGLFMLSVALGSLARTWSGPGRLVRTASAPVTAALAAVASVFVNNLPASVLLASGPVAHTRALLVGLNVGPNLAVTGSLAAYLWWNAARAVDARPSARAFSRQGVLLAPAAIVAALAALWLGEPGA